MLIAALALPFGTALLQGCSSQQPEKSPTVASGSREEHDRQAVEILADIHRADASYKMAEKATLNKRGQLILQVNRQATEAELKPMVAVALKRLTQNAPNPKAAVMVVGPNGQRMATARVGSNGAPEFFDPRQPAR